jgi:hypothetical protein
MSRTSEYRIRLSQLAVVPVPVQPKPSLCYPDRHRRTDEQVALSTLRYLGTMLICVAIVIGIAMAVR